MLKLTASLLNHALSSGLRHASMRRSPFIFMLGVDDRISSIVLDEFAKSAEGRPINAYGMGCRESGVKTVFGLYTVLVSSPSPADVSLILDALEAYGRNVLVSAVASLTPDTSPVGLILIDQQGHAYSTYLVEAGQMKVFFVIRPDDPVIGEIIHGAEGVKRYFSRIFLDV
ncbi:hypothetical protein P692DRAFT_20872834 [Suillus brevipes Sb2]|nr:hypothetical protein P692DRAFT_20872834 [Suillus brevipes Sb2]